MESEFNLASKYHPKMKPNLPDKINTGRTFLIGLGFMTAMAAWAYYNFMIPILLGEMLPSGTYFWIIGQDTTIGFIMTLDNIIAIILQPYFGALSDHMRSKYGRRMPFIIIGITVGAISFIILPYLNAIGLFIAVILLFNLAMAFYRAPVVSLMPDLTPPKVRSTGNAIINLMGAVGTIFGYAAPSITGMIYGSDTTEAIKSARQMGFLMVGMVMLIGLLFLFLTIKETPTGDKFWEIGKHPIAIDPVTLEILPETEESIVEKQEKSSLRGNKWEDVITVFKQEEKSALFMLLAIFSWFFGFNAIEAFYSRYATIYLGWPEGKASLILLILPLLLVLTAVPNGKLAEKIGRIKTMKIGLIGMLTTIFILTFITDMTLAAILIGITGVFWGMININSITVVWQLAPKGKIGAYTGVYYMFSQLAAILSPIVAGFSFDVYTSLHPNIIPGSQYLILFPYVWSFLFIAFLFLTRVKRGEANDLSDEELEALKEKYGADDD